ncbi:MAG: M23 family metallopeptidase, partial [Rhizobacter sp.]|nr:M23 family metallopeptidase [Rhizobacter sp.]
ATQPTSLALWRFALAAAIALAAIGLLGTEVAPLRRLALPVEGVRIAELRDAAAPGAGHRRDAIDIAAPRGTAVVAVDDGTVAKLLTSAAGERTIYQLDPGARYAYHYAHLDRYADGVVEGGRVRRGDVIGYVGTSGTARDDAPHLHFAVVRLGADKRRPEGEAVDPIDAFD